MKELTLNKSQKMYAEKIIKKERTVISEGVTKLVTGQEWDMPEDEEKNQRITDLELALAAILGGGV